MTIADVGRASGLVGLVRERAALQPEAIAVTGRGEQLTYGELDRAANRLGALLRARGVVAGALVAVVVERSPRMHVAVLGVHRAGAAYLPIDPAYPPERIAFMLEDSGAVAVVTEEAVRSALPPIAAALTTISLDRDAAALTVAAADASPLPDDPARLAYTIYTSGSTGRPKGVQVEHRSVVNLLAGFAEICPLGPGDVMLAVAPLSFDVSVLDLFLPLVGGARIVVATREDAVNPAALAALIEQGVTHVQATPSTWRMLIEAGWRGNDRLTAISGGEALGPALAEQLVARAKTVWNVYGPTEATVWATVHRVRAGEPPTIGVPLPNVCAHVLDDALRPVAAGVVGELALGGTCLARGYLNRPELSAERFVPNPVDPERSARLYRTGDLARRRPDGSFEYLGRADTQVKLRGHRVELGEIESVLGAVPGVTCAVAAVREDVRGDPRLVAYLTAEPGSRLAPGALRRRLRAQLPAYMIPDAIELVESFALNANGKVDRSRLPAPRRAAAAAYVAPRTALEARLAAIWEEVLDVHPVGIEDDAFDLGVTSIAAARIVDRVERELGVRLPLSPLFAAPTVARLAALIGGGAHAARWSSLVPIQPHGDRPPLFCVHGGAGTILHFHALARRLGPEQPLYGLQMRGLAGDAPPQLTVEAMAAHYLRELRAVQPHGPYHLGGYCFGALVAFEMAQRLTAAGERIALLFVVNGPTPAYIRRFGGAGNTAPPEPEPRRGAGRLADALRHAWWDVRWRLARECKAPPEQRLLGLKILLCAAFGRPLPGVWRGPAMLAICAAAERRYRPRPYPGALLLFAGEGLYRRADLGWHALVERIELVPVPGRHHNQRDAMDEPKVATIADRLAAVLA